MEVFDAYSIHEVDGRSLVQNQSKVWIAMPRVTTVLLAGGKGSRLEPLTNNDAKPAIPFGGVYRIIDFTLSNCVNSGLRRVFVLTQFKSMSLERHINKTWRSMVNWQVGEFIEPVPAQQRLGDHWYRGNADAVYQNIAQWIPFLAYQRGDVTENIQKLTQSVTDADEIVESAKNSISSKQSEIADIIVKAREASAAAGAAVFTQDFLNEATTLKDIAKKWLTATMILVVVAIGFAAATAFYRPTGLDSGQVAQLMISNLLPSF